MHGKRILREKMSIEKMIGIYCKAKHRSDKMLCNNCQEILEYAVQRLRYCKFGEQKPVCSKCPVQCYRRDMRDKVKAVMRFSGPRMMYKHPILAVLHYIDSIGNCPDKF